MVLKIGLEILDLWMGGGCGRIEWIPNGRILLLYKFWDSIRALWALLVCFLLNSATFLMSFNNGVIGETSF